MKVIDGKTPGLFKEVSFTVILIIFFLVFTACSDEPVSDQPEARAEHPKAERIKGFHLTSYFAGSIATAIEFVSYGVKKLALSSPYKDEEYRLMAEFIKVEAESYGIPILVESDLLVTKLFSSTVAKDRTVVLFAYKQQVLDDYLSLKTLRREAMDRGRLDEIEIELAWKFGRLLSYTDEKIAELIKKSDINQ